MAPQKVGTLVVVVLKARNLPNPSLYKQSPYCLVRFGGGGKRTKEDPRGGQHPVWDEEIHFEIYDHDVAAHGSKILRVGIFTAGKRVDERLGEGEIVIHDVLENGEFDDWVPLSLDGSQRGEVYVELTFFPAAKALAGRPSKLPPSERLWRPLSNPSDTPLLSTASAIPVPPSPPPRPRPTDSAPPLPPRHPSSPQAQPHPTPPDTASRVRVTPGRPSTLSPPPTSPPPRTPALGGPPRTGSIPYIPQSSQTRSTLDYISSAPPTSRPAKSNPPTQSYGSLGSAPLGPVPSFLRPGNQRYASPNSRHGGPGTQATPSPLSSPPLTSNDSGGHVPGRQQANRTALSSLALPPAYDEITSMLDADALLAEDLEREEQERLRAQEAADAELARSLMDEEERVNGGVSAFS